MGPVPRELAVEAIERLIALGKAEMPMILEPYTPRFKVASAALVARILTLGESIVHLSALDRRAELFTLNRCLFEHVVMLAWIAAPRDDSRLDIWQLRDNRDRLKVFNDFTDHGADLDIATDADRDWLREAIEDSADLRGLPPVTELAAQADRDWASLLNPSGSRDLGTLRGSYAVAYRLGSQTAHPTLVGLNFVSQIASAHTVVSLEPRDEVGQYLAPVTSFLVAALKISSVVLGAPDQEAVQEVYVSFGESFRRYHPNP